MLGNIMKTYVILHNIIIEDEREEHLDFDYEISSPTSPVVLSCCSNNDFQSFLSRHIGFWDKNVYHALRNDLIEHVASLRWKLNSYVDVKLNFCLFFGMGNDFARKAVFVCCQCSSHCTHMFLLVFLVLF